MATLSCQLLKKTLQDQNLHPLEHGDNIIVLNCIQQEVYGWKIIQVINEKLKPDKCVYIHISICACIELFIKFAISAISP